MSSFTISTALVASLSLFSTATAHMIMAQPTPYGKSSLNNSPLAADGSDFPCKQRSGVYDAEGASNSYAVGATVPLTFTGSAVHGGGSCQISLTTDKAPTKSTKWMVIHSFEGGCPAKNSNGNTGADTYSFAVPQGVAPGDYTLAWTWFNEIGNEEMYMNCAPFTVTGGSSKRAIEQQKEWERMKKRQNSSSSFPDLYVANLCGSSCQTPRGSNLDIAFPDPGQYVDKLGVSKTLSTMACSCNMAAGGAATAPAAAASGSGSGSSSGSSAGAVTSVAAAAGTSAAAVPAAQATGSSEQAGVTSIPIATVAVTSVASAAAAAPTSGNAAAPSATSSGSSGSSSSSDSSSSGNSTTGTSTCSQEGAMLCSADGSMFGLCSNGAVTYMAVAAGTKCSQGAIQAS